MGNLFICILLFMITTIIVNGNYANPNESTYAAIPKIKGRLLTPEEGCGYSKVANKRIVGGSEAKIGAWPWMALLGYRAHLYDRISFKCGGSLITSRHVLTAAHCENSKLRVVRLAEHDLTTTEDGPHIDVDVAHVEDHEHYDADLDINDIAMVYLENDVEFTDRIRPICLPLDDALQHKSFVGSNPFVAGWGMTSFDGLFSPVLLQVQIPIIKNADCKKKYQKIGEFQADAQFDERIICAGFTEGGKDSCRGDSGGALMLPLNNNGWFPFYQIGIVSNGYGCGEADVPGIYANVAKYADWIKTKLQK